MYQTATSIGLWATANTGKSKEIIGIQCMRYVAALAVLLDHLIVAVYEAGKFPQSWLPFAYKLGDIGVFLFFAISGFVMVITNRTQFQAKQASMTFLSRRLIRIWPMYFLATIMVFAMKFGTDPAYSFINLAKSFTFIPYIGANDLYRPVLGKGWTLNYEIFFYVIFSICLAFPKKLGLMLAGMALIVLSSIVTQPQDVIWHFYTNSIVLYFLVGIVLACAIKETNIHWIFPQHAGWAILSSAVIFAMVLAVNVYVPTGWSRQAMMLLLVLAALYFVCFQASRLASPVISRVVSLLGDSSYCLYLFHGFFFFALKPFFRVLDPTILIVLLPFAIVAITIGCIFVHLFVEKPLTQALMKMVTNKA